MPEQGGEPRLLKWGLELVSDDVGRLRHVDSSGAVEFKNLWGMLASLFPLARPTR